MEARGRARTMKRSASMKRAASRSAARGKAKARARGRARRGGEDGEYDVEMGIEEQKRQEEEKMEEGPLYVPGEYNPDAYEKVGGKRRRSKKFYKGKASKTRKGRKDFVTHKGDKDFNRKGHRQTKRQEKSKGLFEQLFGL